MAPMILNADLEDDFIRTISDIERDPPVIGDRKAHTNEFDSKAPPQSKKRKRQAGSDTKLGLSRDLEAQQRIREELSSSTKVELQYVDKALAEDEDQDVWDGQGEDDGAMDSEFEFQVGNVDTDLLEDLDGWTEKEDSRGFTSQKMGDKKGVDIDDLIARRRKVGHNSQLSNGNTYENGNNIEAGDGSSSESDEEVEEEQEKASTKVELEDEDETLAEDAFGMGADSDVEDEDKSNDSSAQEVENSESEDGAVADTMPEPDEVEDDSQDEDDAEELAKREAFFAPEEPATETNAKGASSSKAFQVMNLSRPILRGLTSVGFTNPTPIQTKTIPVALLAKDVVGGAVTGSGKTGAFIIPILERLLHRPKKVATSRVAILLPTRELAVQCFNVAKKLASFTDITFALLTGGFSLREQENVLRSRPDVIIATPGRFIDHMRNSASFTVDTLEILVLDEADRMLEDGFADELNEILATIPRSRQTMLFSATMTDRVDKLIRVGLNRPVRLMVDARKQTVVTLTQEFVRLRPGREDKRLGYLVHLCSDLFTDRVIIFFRQKKEAHRVRIIFGLLGIGASELHGSMSQDQVNYRSDSIGSTC